MVALMCLHKHQLRQDHNFIYHGHMNNITIDHPAYWIICPICWWTKYKRSNMCRKCKDIKSRVNPTLCIYCGKVISYKSNTCINCRSKNRIYLRWPDHPSWKWSTLTALARKNIEYIEWRKSVRERDWYICQICLKHKWKNWVAHHIYWYSKYSDLRYNIDNWVTLCKRCHNLVHTVNWWCNYDNSADIFI